MYRIHLGAPRKTTFQKSFLLYRLVSEKLEVMTAGIHTIKMPTCNNIAGPGTFKPKSAPICAARLKTSPKADSTTNGYNNISTTISIEQLCLHLLSQAS